MVKTSTRDSLLEDETGEDWAGEGFCSSFDRALRDARPDHSAALGRSLEGRALAGGRILVGRRIGGGAMGVVYEAWDQGSAVALKVLDRLHETQVYRLKTEFRRLAQLNHPNLVCVYELFNEAGEWFFSMERLHGLPLHRYLEVRLLADQTLDPEMELRELMRQLIEGIAAVHGAGLVHRDIKPANVLVTSEGRLVIVDFGLVSEQLVGGVGQTIDNRVSGTLGYLSPEQLRGAPPTTSSDCYALGATLHHLLTGSLPRSPADERRDSEVGPVVARGERPLRDDLNELSARLLAADPSARPTIQELLEICRDWPGADRGRNSLSSTPPAAPFVGREEELKQMHEAWARARPGQSSILLVQGANGVGKTALLRQFVSRLAQEGVVVLEGRCSEWESLPYKGLDEVIDALSRLLLRMPPDKTAQLVPRHMQAIARAFPTLLRVDAFRKAASDAPKLEAGEEWRLHWQVVAGLKDLFYRLAERDRVAIVIDDMQWVDGDTLELLSDVLSPPDPPRVFVLGSLSEAAQNAHFQEPLSRAGGVSKLVLRPLPPDDSQKLLHALAAEAQAELSEAMIERAVRESGGMPLYISEIVQALGDASVRTEPLLLSQMLLARLDRLSPHTRQLLNLIAVAVRPLTAQIASECGVAEVQNALRQLLAERLIRSVALPKGELALEPYTEHLRQVVLHAMPEREITRAHTALVQALENLPEVEEHWLLSHYRGAGKYEHAKRYSLIMAERALSVLAFERAASLYLAALELATENSPEWVDLNLRCADALARAGRGAEAAQAYMRAARGAGAEQRAVLLNQAVTQWIRTGHLAEGVKLLRSTLESAGIDWPETPSAAIFRFVMKRLTIRARGLECTPRRESEVPPELLRKLDALNPAQTALGSFDYLRGAMFSAIALPLALEAGEPKRLIVALASEAVYASMTGGLGGEHRALSVQRQIDLLRRHDTGPYELAVSRMTRAVSAYWMGRWKEVLVPAQQAEGVLEKQVAGAAWELALLRSIRHTVLLHGGRQRELAEELPDALGRSSVRNDLYAYMDLLRRGASIQLTRDDVSGALATLDELAQLRRRSPFLAADHLIMSSVVATHLYVGDVERAKSELERRWRECQEMGMNRLPLVRLTVIGMQGDCAMADQSVAPAVSAQRLNELAKAASGEKVAWANALRAALLAGAAELTRDYPRAVVQLRAAADLFDTAGMSTAALVARFRLARLFETDESQTNDPHQPKSDVHAEADSDLFREANITRPESWVRLAHSLY